MDSLIFSALTHVFGYVALMASALCIACGLYCAAEIAEEYSTIAKKVLKWALIVVFVIHLLFILSGVPLSTILTSSLCHLVYASLLKDFPYVEPLSAPSIGSLIAVGVSHYCWFQFFYSNYVPIFQVRWKERKREDGGGGRARSLRAEKQIVGRVCLVFSRSQSKLSFLHPHPSVFLLLSPPPSSLQQVTGFFLVMIWAVPLGFFVSLSMGDDALPVGLSGEKVGAKGGSGKSNVFKFLFDTVAEKYNGWVAKKSPGLGKYK